MNQLNPCHLPVDNIQSQWITEGGVNVDMLRLDSLHPDISGNKWFKLKYHIDFAQKNNYSGLVSFGGAWSNHIHAMAAAGRELNISVTGIIRGEQSETLSDTLIDAMNWGMKLAFVSRKDYRLLQLPERSEELYQRLGELARNYLIVPEGGSGERGVRGCGEILSMGGINSSDYDEIWLPVGTGATATGIIRSVNNQAFVRAIAVLKGAGWLNDAIKRQLPSGLQRWQVECDDHCGGYARATRELLAFLEAFHQETGIMLDHVYTGKMLLALKRKVQKGELQSGCRILLIHTGGLQGLRGLSTRSYGIIFSDTLFRH